MTTAGLPPSVPLHLFGAKERGQMAGAQCPPAQGGRMPGGRCCWTNRHLTTLASVAVSLTLSLVVRNRGTSVPKVGSQDQKLPSSFPLGLVLF